MTDYFELGRVLKPQGIKGEVKAEAYTDDTNRFHDLTFVFFKSGGEYAKRELESVRVSGGFAYLKFAGINDRDSAEILRGQYFYIDRANAAKLPPGSHYISDLLGMEVREGGKKTGVLENILQTGSRDVYVVKLDAGGTLMFPSVDGVFVKKDVENSIMELNGEKLAEVAVYDL